MNSITINAVMQKDASLNVWVAIGLEHYIAAQGATEEETVKEFMKTVVSEIAYRSSVLENRDNPLKGIEQAPQHYWDLYNRSIWEMVSDYSQPKLGSAPPIPSKVEPQCHFRLAA